MADFNQAVKWIREGKSVKRKNQTMFQYWDNEHAMISSDATGYDYRRFTEVRFNIEDYEATDWGIYIDPEITIMQDIKPQDNKVIITAKEVRIHPKSLYLDVEEGLLLDFEKTDEIEFVVNGKNYVYRKESK